MKKRGGRIRPKKEKNQGAGMGGRNKRSPSTAEGAITGREEIKGQLSRYGHVRKLFQEKRTSAADTKGVVGGHSTDIHVYGYSSK